MSMEPLQLLDVGLRCSCKKSLLILANALPRPGLYICPRCNEKYTITIEQMESDK